MAKMNLNTIQDALKAAIANGKNELIVGGTLSRHSFLTKAKTAEQAAKEKAEKNLSFDVQPGYSFSIKDAKPLQGEGILRDYIGSLVNDGFLEVRPQKFMPDLLAMVDGQVVSITEEFKDKAVSYNGEIQVKFIARESKGRAYVNCAAVLFATKPDVFVAEGSEGRNLTGWYGTQTAVEQQAAAPVQAPTAAATVETAPTASPW